jgi:hypothetical protein
MHRRPRSGPHMVACTAKPISIGLQPSGKSLRHQRPRSPVNQPRKRSDGRLHVRRLSERSRWPANAAHHTRNASACSVAIRTLSGCHGLGMYASGRGGEGQAAPVLRNRNAPPSTLNGYAEISLAVITYLKVSGSRESSLSPPTSAWGYMRKPTLGPDEPGSSMSCAKL